MAKYHGMAGATLRASALVLLVATALIAGCPLFGPPGGGDTPPAAFTAADANRGGALYDKFWAVAGVDAPTTDHARWAARPDMDSNTRTGSDTWRCKECHGWDYKGVDGAYASGSHRTGIAGIFGTTLTAQEAFDEIKTGHGYDGTGLSDDDIWDLAKFVLEGQMDTAPVITDRAFTGTVADGQAPYDSACMVCHGADGLTPPPGADAGFDAFVGFLSNDNPWEFLHKVRFGHPGTAMPPQAGILTDTELGDLGAFAQSLPTAAP